MPLVKLEVYLSGVDVENASAFVDWPIFVELYCICESGRLDSDLLARFWIKFFDPKLNGFVPEYEYLRVLEELVRGLAFKKANKTPLISIGID